MSEQTIIGLCGPIGAGKTAAAKFFMDYGFERIRFAGPLKAMCAAIGLTHEQTDGSLKEVPEDLICDKTPREFMQLLGTEFGRVLIGSELWVRAWSRAVSKTRNDIVADDVRFFNELHAIKRLGGTIIEVVRPGITSGDHVSEQQGVKGDVVIVNNGTLEELGDKVDDALKDIWHGSQVAA